MLAEESERPCGKKFQGSRPARRRSGRKSVGADLGEPSKEDRVDEHREDRLQDRPGRSEHRLLVTKLDVTPTRKYRSSR